MLIITTPVTAHPHFQYYASKKVYQKPLKDNNLGLYLSNMLSKNNWKRNVFHAANSFLLPDKVVIT